MNSLLTSVVIPAYNQARFLREAIGSALSQTYERYEVIVVDDGSTDQTPEIAKSFGDRLRYIHQQNRGLAAARNAGIRAAQGELIALLDSDDIWEPGYLQSMISLAQAHPEASVFYSCAQCVDAAGNQLPQIVGKKTVRETDLRSSLLQSNFLIPSTITVRRETVVEANYFDDTLRSCEDWDLWLRILPEARFVGTESVLVRYRVHEQSLSADVSGMHAAKRAVVEKHFGSDDRDYQLWPPEKRMAYSGLYRYFVITSIQRGGDWEAGIENLFNSLRIVPARAMDIDLFYELALGAQPVGYRGSPEKIDIEGNARLVGNLIESVFRLEKADQIEHLRRRVFGTAQYAIGLVAFNAGRLKLSRRFLWLAGLHQPALWTSRKMASTFLKALLGSRLLGRLRRMKAPGWKTSP